MQRREIVPGVYGLGSEQVNWYLVEEDGKLSAVDAGLPGFASDLPSDLGALGLSLEDVEAVVLTHSDVITRVSHRSCAMLARAS